MPDGSASPLAAINLTLDDEMQYRCAGYIQAEIERYSDFLVDNDGSADSEDAEKSDKDSNNEEEMEEEEGTSKKKRKANKVRRNQQQKQQRKVNKEKRKRKVVKFNRFKHLPFHNSTSMKTTTITTKTITTMIM